MNHPVPVPEIPRRRLLKAGLAGCAVGLSGFPALVRAQPDEIAIGHLTPLTGFLGPLGEYAVMSIKLAVDEINAAGGVLGRPLRLLSEDSVNPSTASSKAQRLFERDNAQVLIGEISSASALAIAQVAQRHQRIFINTGANSDELRGKACNRFMFNAEASNTMYVRACGQALLAKNMVKGKKWFTLTADYAFGHDLLRAAKEFLRENGGTVVAEELLATDTTDFSPYMLKIRQARPDVVISNLSGNQITNFIKQYAEFGLPYPVAGFGFDTALAWGAGPDNFDGIWPATWFHSIQTPSAQAFVKAFTARYGKPPDNQAWGEYVSLKAVVQAMTETKSTDANKMVDYFEKQPEIDVLKQRKGYFRAWDHQLMQEMYTMKRKPKDRSKWDFLELSAPVPGPGAGLETLATARPQSECRLG